MGSFYEPLPYFVDYKGKRYELTPAFNNVLSMYQAIEGCTDSESLDIMLYFLLKKHRCPKEYGLLKQITDILFDQKPSKRERCFDFIQDSDLIYSAFLQAYGIDLYKEQGKLHWLQFKALLGGLPSATKLSEVIAIRLKPLPKPTKYNQREIAELMRLKQSVKLKISEAERQENLQAGLTKMAVFLTEWAKDNDRRSGSI